MHPEYFTFTLCLCSVPCMKPRLWHTLCMVSSKQKRPLLILRRMQHCTFSSEEKKKKKARASKRRSKHNSPSKTFRPLISFIPHLTWEGTLMWNSLMIYCDCCLNACTSILRRSPSVLLFLFLSSPVLLSVSLQRGHFEGWRQSTEHRRHAFEQREARRRSDHVDAERPGSPVPDRVWRLCHGWAHTHTHTNTHGGICGGIVGRRCSEGKYMWPLVDAGDATRGVTLACERASQVKG